MRDYLSALPADLLHHLTQVGWLEDVDVVAFTTTKRVNFNIIGSRYERTTEQMWFLHRVEDVTLHFQLPWTNLPDEESEPYLLTSTQSSADALANESENPPPPTSPAHEFVVILRHTLHYGLVRGWTSLPLSSFVPKEYRHSPHQIGHMTRLVLYARGVPKPGSLVNYLRRKPDQAIQLQNLSFVPLRTLKHLTLLYSLVRGLEMAVTSTGGDPQTTPIWPINLEHLELDGATPRLFSPEMMPHWPASLTRIILNPDFSDARPDGFFETEGQIHYPPEKINFPNTLLSLTLDNAQFKYETHLVRFPSNLTELQCTPTHPLKDWKNLPHTLRSCVFSTQGRELNKSLMERWCLPSELTDFVFGPPAHSDEPIDGLIFNDKLVHLDFGGWNPPLLSVSLPSSLTELCLSHSFNPINRSLLDLKLPPHLEILHYGRLLDPRVRDPKYFSSLPTSLTHLTFGPICKEIAVKRTTLKLQLLVNLVHLQLPLHLLMEVDQLPSTLRSLQVTCKSPLDKRLDRNLLTLNRLFASAINLQELDLALPSKSLDGLILPPTLEQLLLGSKQNLPWEEDFDASNNEGFNHSLVGVQFSPKLKHFTLGDSFNQPMDKVLGLPDTLESLHFGLDFNHSLMSHLPIHLKSLELSRNYDRTFDGLILPDDLERFILGDTIHVSKFTHLDSLIHLALPVNLKEVCLPNPLQHSYQTHPLRAEYQSYVDSLVHSHPYLLIRFTPWNDERDDSDNDYEDDEDEYEDEDE